MTRQLILENTRNADFDLFNDRKVQLSSLYGLEFLMSPNSAAPFSDSSYGTNFDDNIVDYIQSSFNVSGSSFSSFGDSKLVQKTYVAGWSMMIG